MYHLLKISFLLISCNLISLTSFSQANLVPNPSFEQKTCCPDVLCQIHRSVGWSSWGYSPDYYNVCAAPYPISRVSIPLNDFGYQFAFDGNAYSGFYAFEPIVGSDIREYISTQLISPLIVNAKYYVRFRVSLSDISSVSVNNIGAWFSTVSFEIDSSSACTNTITSLTPQNFAQVYSSTVISDTINWTTIIGSFISDSTYQYIAIGNHFKDANTLNLPSNTTSACCYAYYYLDDVYVGTDSLAALGINVTVLDNSVCVFPNPVSNQINIQLNDSEKGIAEIYNVLGEIVTTFVVKKDMKIDVSQFLPGIYYLKISIKGNCITKKIIITH